MASYGTSSEQPSRRGLYHRTPRRLALLIVSMEVALARCTDIWLWMFHFYLPPARQRPGLPSAQDRAAR